MPYVNVPKDLKRVQTKVISGFTKRQLICILTAVLVGAPIQFLTYSMLGDLAVFITLIILLPLLILAFYEPKDGRKPEEIFLNFIRVRFRLPRVRYWQAENSYNSVFLYEQIEEVIRSAEPVAAETDRRDKKGRSLRRASKRAKKTHR